MSRMVYIREAGQMVQRWLPDLPPRVIEAAPVARTVHSVANGTPTEIRISLPVVNALKDQATDHLRGAERTIRPSPTPGKVHLLAMPSTRCRCSWPTWTDTTPPAERFYCGEAITPGRTYCGAHRARAYTNNPEKRSPWRDG